MSPKKTVRAKRIYAPLDKVMVRLPLLPVEFYRGLCSGKELKYSGLDETVKYALRVGSRSLSSALERGASTPKDRRNDQSKLLRYLIRMSTRPTPYGLFAAVGIAGTAERSALTRPAEIRTVTRPDMAWLFRLVCELEANREIRRFASVAANPSAYVHGNRVYLHEKLPSAYGRPGAGVSLRATRAVRKALELAREYVPYRDLVAGICSIDSGYSEAKVEALLDELFAQTLLITELRPPLTNLDPAGHVVKVLRKIPAANPMLRNLEAFAGILADCDKGSFSERFARYEEAQKFAESFSGTSGAPVAHVDAAVDLRGSAVSGSVTEEVACAAEALLSITPYPRGFSHLDPYLASFEAKYGPAREVPLLELLDPNFGLGPPPDCPGGFGAGASGADLSRHDQALVRLAADALYEKKQVVLLDENALNSLKTCELSPSNAPDSLDVFAFVAASSEEEIDKGNFRVVIGPNLGAIGAGRIFGRFCHLLDGKITAVVSEISRLEERADPGRVRAELVYIPEQYRSGNVLLRAGSRKYEIVLGVTPGVSRKNLIRLDELVVGIKDRRFYLRSPRLNAQVLISNGHVLDYSSAPAACKFLIDIGRASSPQLYVFDWGPAGNFPFLPRVQYGRSVLSPAQWRMRPGEFKAPDRNDFERMFGSWKARWNVPRHVYLSCGDNRLLLDTGSGAHVREIYGELLRAGEGGIVLQEVCPGLDEAWVKGASGHYMSELIVPLVRSKEGALPGKSGARAGRKAAAPRKRHRITAAAAREIPPGGEWLYLKLYCGKDLEEELLSYIGQFISGDAVSGYAEEVFFVRNSDPDPHIRLHFRGKPAELTGKLLPAVCDWAAGLMKEKVCLRFAFDTYCREIERFGGDRSIALAESVFAADTDFVLKIAGAAHSNKTALDRIDLAVLSLRNLLEALGLDENGSVEWCAKMVPDRDAASGEYRRRKKILQDLLAANGAKLKAALGATLFNALRELRTALKPLGSKFKRLEAGSELQSPYWDILRSVAKTHCNRLLGTDHRVEDIVLGLLLRTLQGNRARRPARK